MSLKVYQDDKIFQFALSNLHELTGARYIPGLDFINFETLHKVVKKIANLKKKNAIDQQWEWLSVYFQNDLLLNKLPDVSLRWIDKEVGWGIFAERDLQEMTYITEYSGKVRKRRKSDSKNSYCFEYLLIPNKSSSYIIDAMDQGGISRYINHSFQPNLRAALVNVGGINHIILYTTRKIVQGTQLCYNYGPDYWKARGAPLQFI